ncbi:Integral membrane protein possibly involved in chromosome condensation [Anoxybacillus flavithermus TNO-09.006]|uniref:Fluoride-specific ion channel FluC n=2 Tax=Anoxybacillus flavithermus TaxID=33934 RepID=A0A178TKB3_9BACL|nr:CrcB family protein [Anoxybacillus flavithermus]ELK21471.1 Integral membrane protein possibly involved in chromosome condensation [Anoxybacillus flavithermus TNO-09.006]OAO81434.1 CrcB protein [Anoxybacillus flavithermus]
MMKESGAVAIGGAFGALCRYGVALLFPFLTFPWGTLFVNYIGSFLLGALTSYVGKGKMAEWLRLAIGTGFCGGLTTMSTFSKETVVLWHVQIASASLYVVASLVGGLLLCYAGIYVGERVGARSVGEAS